jgi:hypothetical protein
VTHAQDKADDLWTEHGAAGEPPEARADEHVPVLRICPRCDGYGQRAHCFECEGGFLP